LIQKHGSSSGFSGEGRSLGGNSEKPSKVRTRKIKNILKFKRILGLKDKKN